MQVKLTFFENAPIKLTERQSMILQKFREDNTLTKEGLCIKTGLSDATAKREIAYLKRIGVLRRIGSKKNGYTLDNAKNLFFHKSFFRFLRLYKQNSI